jgi:uncharacterized protein
MRSPGRGSDPDRIANAPEMRVVCDTNVVVSALVFGRRLRWLRQAWSSGEVIPIVCRETAAELLRVLAYPKFRLSATEREVLLGEYLPFAEVAHLPEPPPELPTACRDHSDAPFLQLALATHAELLISGDEDLTVLATAYPVASPATLRRLLARN